MTGSSGLWDVCLITDSRYTVRQPGNAYVENIFADEDILWHALEKRGLRVTRRAWDDPEADWPSVRLAVFRTTWDYFERLDEFLSWFERTSEVTRFLNPAGLVRWNLDKAYLWELASRGIRIPSGLYLQKGTPAELDRLCDASQWQEFILKPAISGTARHTYRFEAEGVEPIKPVFNELLASESMILQEFLPSVPEEGEVSLVMIGGRFSHAVRKKARPGDFRVQDDFGGTLHSAEPDAVEIDLATKALLACPVMPLYARVDLVRDKDGLPCVSELELIEPELWFRRNPASGDLMAELIAAELRTS